MYFAHNVSIVQSFGILDCSAINCFNRIEYPVSVKSFLISFVDLSASDVTTFLFTFLDTYDSVSSYCNFRAATPTLLSNDWSAAKAFAMFVATTPPADITTAIDPKNNWRSFPTILYLSIILLSLFLSFLQILFKIFDLCYTFFVYFGEQSIWAVHQNMILYLLKRKQPQSAFFFIYKDSYFDT